MAFTLNVANSGTASGISLAASGTPDLVVACFTKDVATDPTGVQYGGVAMTRLTETVNGAQGAEIWYLVSGIPSGTQSITYTLSGAHRCWGGAFDVGSGNVAQFDTEAGASGTSTGPSVTFTPGAQPNVIIACCAHEGASIMTAKGTGQVGMEAGAGDGFIDEGTWNSACTYEATTSTAANNQTFTNAASDTWSMRVASFKEVTPTVTLTAARFRWYADDAGGESGAAALGNEDAGITIRLGDGVDKIAVLRYGIQESGGAAGASTDDWQLQVNVSGAGYVDVTSSSADVNGGTSPNLTDAAATTQRLANGTGSFVAGEIAETDGLCTDFQITANNFTELLFVVELDASDLLNGADGDTLDFRVLRNGAVLDTYSVTPRITVNALHDPRTLTAEAGSVPITGTAASPEYNRLVAAESGSVPITGTAATVGRKLTLMAAAGAVPITGTDATLTYQEGGATTLVAESGSIPITGTAAGLARRLTLAAAGGAVPIAGTDAGLREAHLVSAQAGSVPITGTAATTRVNHRVDAQAGSIPITGTAAGLKEVHKVSAEAGAVPITGSAATLTYVQPGSYTLVADPGSVPIAGTAAGLRANRRVDAQAGAVPISGTAATLYIPAFKLVAASGNVPITGTAAVLTGPAPEVPESDVTGRRSQSSVTVSRRATSGGDRRSITTKPSGRVTRRN